ncbi:M23 family metallopeptidase [Pseudanabaenaceae cyanobacterium LEGE 13415]|nr:M23 family metallopeptidase [Pseudanabaenaceae cyanobacterium LEGE 13415]
MESEPSRFAVVLKNRLMTRPCFNATFILRTLMLSGFGSVIGLGEIAQAQTPAVIDPIPQTQIAAPAGGDAFIDRTDYSLGATERIEPEKSIAKPVPAAPKSYASDSVSVAPVEVGGFKLSTSGIGWSAPAPEPTNPIGSAYSTVQTYYNRTVRPIGRIGNGDLKLIFPLSIPAPITSLFGWRLHPITGDARLHTGTDIGAPLGTPVLAALTGRVIMADFFGGYGLAIGLEHNAGAQQTLYAHLSEIFVKPGEIVKQGSVIGRVGSTGNSTGPHLHFEVRQQTTEGWVAMDAGVVLETAMADLIKSMQVAQAPKTR